MPLSRRFLFLVMLAFGILPGTIEGVPNVIQFGGELRDVKLKR
jgi:hypothetical protein